MRAIVTGASRGIGRAVAVELQARGVETFAGMRQVADVPSGCIGLELDVTAPGELPEVDVLVSNAGVDLDHVPLEHASTDAWRQMFETNVLGLMAVTRAVIPGMRARGGGVICSVTSSSIIAPVPFYSGYRASKAAVSALCDSLRTEVAQFGIRVVEVLPGPIDTDMYADAAGEHHPAEAFADYAEQARRVKAASQGADALLTPAADAARDIVDVLLAGEGPMRHGCDQLSKGLLELWRTTSDEAIWAAMGSALA